MKITFEDQSYIEVSKSTTTPDSLFISIASKVDNKLSINSVELTQEQFSKLLEIAKKD